jgi:nucleotide-binding universal stress UspA family protein
MSAVFSGVGPVVVGVDASPGAALAVVLAGRLAVDLVAAVVLVHGSYSSPDGPPGEEVLAGWRALLVEAGVVDVRTVVEADDAGRLLFRVAEEVDAYLIVVGPPHRSEVGDLVMGSVALELAHHGRRPLVIAATADSEINPF